MSRVEFGYVDFVSRSYQEGRLTFFRTSAGRGRAFITIPDTREQIFQPSSFARACDQIADAKQVTRAFMWNELAMRGIIVNGRSWRIESSSGDVMAAGIVLDVFDTPHEIVHGLSVAVATIAHPSLDAETSERENVKSGQIIAKGFRILDQFGGSAVDRGNPL